MNSSSSTNNSNQSVNTTTTTNNLVLEKYTDMETVYFHVNNACPSDTVSMPNGKQKFDAIDKFVILSLISILGGNCTGTSLEVDKCGVKNNRVFSEYGENGQDLWVRCLSQAAATKLLNLLKSKNITCQWGYMRTEDGVIHNVWPYTSDAFIKELNNRNSCEVMLPRRDDIGRIKGYKLYFKIPHVTKWPDVFDIVQEIDKIRGQSNYSIQKTAQIFQLVEGKLWCNKCFSPGHYRVTCKEFHQHCWRCGEVHTQDNYICTVRPSCLLCPKTKPEILQQHDILNHAHYTTYCPIYARKEKEINLTTTVDNNSSKDSSSSPNKNKKNDSNNTGVAAIIPTSSQLQKQDLINEVKAFVEETIHKVVSTEVQKHTDPLQKEIQTVNSDNQKLNARVDTVIKQLSLLIKTLKGDSDSITIDDDDGEHKAASTNPTSSLSNKRSSPRLTSNTNKMNTSSNKHYKTQHTNDAEAAMNVDSNDNEGDMEEEYE